MPSAEKVIVVGAGVGGLSAAIALRRAGIDVTVYEKQSDPRVIESGGGFILWNNAIKGLRQLGVADEVQQKGAELKLAEWRTPNGSSLGAWPVADVSREVGAPVAGIRRTNIQSALVRAVGEGVLRLGVECTGYTQEGDSVAVLLGDGSEDRADVLLGADGLNSLVRAELHGGRQEPRSAGYFQKFAITDVQTDVATAGTFLEIDGRGLRFFIFPVGGGETYWAAATPYTKEVEGEVGSPAAKAQLLERYRGWMEPVEALLEGTEAGAIYRRDIVDRKPLKSWGDGRVTLLGDAAHPMTPNLGQGAGQAIEDAVVFAKCLAEDGEVADALRAYEAKRIPRTTSFVRRSRLIGRMGRLRNPAACVVRDAIGRIMIPRAALSDHRRDMAHQL
jgi:2-polyprenyl-6-methoxyphenol hydroxylase-like FAD-dependent oxidoreductase